MKYALPIALISLGGLVLVEMDTFMLGILSTKEQVSIYSIAKQLCSKATHINYAIVVGTMTSFSVIKRENVQEKKKKFYKISKINFAITLLIAILFWAFTKPIIGLLYGNQYLGAGNVIKMLLPYYILYGVSNYYASFLDFQQKLSLEVCLYFDYSHKFSIKLAFYSAIWSIWGSGCNFYLFDSIYNMCDMGNEKGI